MAFMGIPFDSRQQQAEDGSFYEDREVFSADIANYFGFLSSNGICLEEGEELSNQFLVQKGTGAQVILNPGTVKIQGRMGWITEQEIVVAEAGGALPRYDTAVIELNLTTSVRNFVFKLVKGTEASSPTPPELTRTENVYQLGVANIYRTANSTALGTITDTRLDKNRCGISTVSVPNVSSQTLLDWQHILPTITSLDDILQLQAKNPIAGASTPEEALANLDGISVTKLWENASPTSVFAEQTINVQCKGYDKILFECAYSKSDLSYEENFVVGAEKRAILRELSNASYANTTYYARRVEIAETSITIKDCYKKKSVGDSTAGTVDNGYLIPQKIYGVKGVS